MNVVVRWDVLPPGGYTCFQHIRGIASNFETIDDFYKKEGNLAALRLDREFQGTPTFALIQQESVVLLRADLAFVQCHDGDLLLDFYYNRFQPVLWLSNKLACEINSLSS